MGSKKPSLNATLGPGTNVQRGMDGRTSNAVERTTSATICPPSAPSNRVQGSGTRQTRSAESGTKTTKKPSLNATLGPGTCAQQSMDGRTSNAVERTNPATI